MLSDPTDIDRRLEFFSELLSCQNHFYRWVYDSDGFLQQTNCKDLALNKLFVKSSSFQYLLEHSRESSAPLLLSSSLNLSWCAAFEHLDGKLHRIHVIGPVFTSEPPLSEISNVLKSSRITDHWKPKFIAILQRVPVTSTSSLLQQLLMLHYCITNEKLLVSDIVFQHNKAPLSNEGSTVGRDRMNVYRAEQAMLRMVREGDSQYEEALGAVAMVSTGAHIMEGSALSKAKVSQIIFITLCSRAAIEGGLSPEVAYSRSDAYIQDVLDCKTVSEAASIGHTMYQDFIQLVHKCRTNPNLSKSVQSCCDYIENHLSEKITLSFLAKRVGYADYYLSRRFKDETGVSINTYIKIAKIERAKMLLSTTQKSIQEISDGLNFGTRSFFSEAFKSIVGMTPAAYRQKYQHL
ncbi:helix-turn-helix domain-containing protein [Faecalibacterium prausnitzii]|uniref:helix-turn-helix domain-containing protein n=1 Tax=Faecalibacterium prausnitzii TaxID=853 RepID=UPI0012DEB74A|nr:AraC family transcriptional regulator [Faecalibacterium prausnitzii]